MAMNACTKLVVVPVLKGFDSLLEMVELAKKVDVNIDFNRVEVLANYHFGGYAKSERALDKFVKSFNSQSKFNIEPVYTAKAMFAMNEYLSKVQGKKKALFVHTGGLFNV
jgi:1-aminocyclopropane-1-carboxylate deaminase